MIVSERVMKGYKNITFNLYFKDQIFNAVFLLRCVAICLAEYETFMYDHLNFVT